MNSCRILVVDDEEDLCEILQFNLETEGYKVDVAYSAEEALKKNLTVYNLLLLDVMMGEMSGFRMAKILQDNPATTSIPVIFLTAKDSENDRITGFSIGADDYISKPFSIREVLARVKAVLRRVAEANPLPEIQKSQVISYDQLELILDKKKVLLNGEALSFTKKEFEMLKLFLENRNRVFTRDEILTNVWGNETIVGERTIDVHIRKLREKLGDDYIRTIKGVGYTFVDSEK